MVLSVAGGGIVGLAAGLADRVGLLLAWLAAATVGASIAFYLSVPQPEADERVVYSVLTTLFFVGGPAAVGCALGWLVRRFRTGRAPWRAIGFAALVVVYVVMPEGPARDVGIYVLVVVAALLLKTAGTVGRAMQRRRR